MKTIDKKPLRALIAPLLAVILILLNRQGGTYSGMTKIEMNLTLLIVFLVELLVAIATPKNTTKIFWLIGAIATSLETIFYNFFEEGGHFPLTSVHEIINGVCGIWLVISLPAFIYLLIVCTRVARWTQTDWEKVKEIRSEYRKEQLERHVKLREIINYYKLEQKKQKALLGKHNIDEKIKEQEYLQAIKTERREGELKEKKEQNKHNFEMNQKRRLSEKTHQEKTDKMRRDMEISELEKELENKNEIKNLRQKRKLDAEQNKQSLLTILKLETHTTLKYLLPFLITFLIIFFYIKIPIKDGGNGISEWIQQTEQFMKTFQDADGGNNNLGTFDVLAKYTIFYIALVGTTLSVIFLIWKTVEGVLEWMRNGVTTYTGFSGFFSEYSTPFVILIVAVSVLLTLLDAGTIMENLPELFKTLAGTVLCIMLTLIAADVIRLIIDQSIRRGSLLRTAMHLTFVLFIENVMGIALGVLAGINLKAVITSLISFFLHRENEDLYQNVEKTMNDALNEEVNLIRKRRKGISTSSRFSSKRWSGKKP